VFERLFHERGLPANIRGDNGVPFASPHALFQLSRLAVWWLRLGIGIERIRPGHPHQNGRHERLRLTLKKEATKPAAPNLLQQQARFDTFLDIFNNERPHEALNMQCPADVYRPSLRPYTGLPDLDYPLHDKTIVVTRCGRICLGKHKINFSQVFAGQAVGIEEVHDDIWLVHHDRTDRFLRVWRLPHKNFVRRIDETLKRAGWHSFFEPGDTRGEVLTPQVAIPYLLNPER
jgi:putative transposase